LVDLVDDYYLNLYLMSTIVLIPARSGSTRIKNKNTIDLGGIPLLAHSIIRAKESNATRVIVSTDSPDIADIAKAYGAEVPFMRPPSLAASDSTSLSVILHAISVLAEQGSKPTTIVFKPPTNPFLATSSINTMMEKKKQNPSIKSVLSIYTPRTSPLSFVSFDPRDSFVTTEVYDIDGIRLFDIERSQDRPLAYASSPACKVTDVDYFDRLYLSKSTSIQDMANCAGPTYNPESCLGHIISPIEAHDIDNMEDLGYCRYILSSGYIKFG